MSDNFITEIIDANLREGLPTIATRFPPEPNGFLHIGHAKSICLNFGLAKRYGGRCHLRFDDTNPLKEDTKYVDSIQQDVRWLGFDWGEHLYFASDWFDKMYAFAHRLIDAGLAYVDSQSVEVVREQRGGFGKDGVDSPFRNRTVAENKALFTQMREGKFSDGTHVLRAKIDMTHPNMLMRDPLLYRIRHATHHRPADDWCIYPMYDFAHCLEDAIEGITHSICTLEFESNRQLYDWVLDAIGGWAPRPRQYEFARLKLDYTVMSKRKLLRLVENNQVDGWDDPRLPTIAGMRRRGVTPEALRQFAELVGIAKNNTTVDIGKLEYCIRQDLETRTPRALAIIEPLPLEITNWPKERIEQITLPWRADDPSAGSRQVAFGRNLFIEADDFALDPPKGWRRLSVGREVRLMGAYLVTCTDVTTDAEGNVIGLKGQVDLKSQGGAAPDGRKVKGTLHWLSAPGSERAEVRLFDRLFSVASPEADPDVDFIEHLNPDSLIVQSKALIEKALLTVDSESRWQFIRQGYFVADRYDHSPDTPVFNRVIGLRDSWSQRPDQGRPERAKASTSKSAKKSMTKRKPADIRAAARQQDSGLALAYNRFVQEHGFTEEQADLLSADRAIADFIEEALSSGTAAASIASWAVNQLLVLHRQSSMSQRPMRGKQFGELVGLTDSNTISKSAAKSVLAEMARTGRDPTLLVDELGVGKAADPSALVGEAIDGLLLEYADETARYRAGERQLMGFFMGQAMRRLKGKADGQVVRTELLARLG
ncbi:MAG TPA: glutamine--tRNA ligase [Myxococcales bacterium]|nr:glutamine--tRNA ligase [Myxococcales bacterium]